MKLKKDVIEVGVLEEYLNDASDFDLELRVLSMLVGKGIPCEHGGQYQDPDTKKFREFDIRARITLGCITCHAAIECKAIGRHFPLLVSCVPRNAAEAMHQVFMYRSDGKTGSADPFAFPDLSVFESIEGTTVPRSQLYPEGEPVGKSTAQVGRRDNKDAELVANDAEFFEKWSQALQSLDELIYEIADRDVIHQIWDGTFHMATALPIVIVPDGTLWTVNYALDGSRDAPPSQTDRVSIYIGRSYGGGIPNYSFNVSHLEVMTETGLEKFCDEVFASEEAIEKAIAS